MMQEDKRRSESVSWTVHRLVAEVEEVNEVVDPGRMCHSPECLTYHDSTLQSLEVCLSRSLTLAPALYRWVPPVTGGPRRDP